MVLGLGAQGLSFSISTGTVENVVSQLVRYGVVRRGSLGLYGMTIAAPSSLNFRRRLGVSSGTLVSVVDVAPGGPSSQSGLEKGDWIIACDGRPVSSLDELYKLVSELSPGTRVTLTVIRSQSSVSNIVVVLGSS